MLMLTFVYFLLLDGRYTDASRQVSMPTFAFLFSGWPGAQMHLDTGQALMPTFATSSFTWFTDTSEHVLMPTFA
jgi:hypothetical protein